MDYVGLFRIQRREEISKAISESVQKAFNKAEKEGISLGKDSRGNIVKAPSLKSLGVFVDKWWVIVKFPKDDFSSLKKASIDELRNPVFVKELKRDVKAATHIIPAVRMFAHIQESYEKELVAIESLLGTVEEVQAHLIERRFGALLEAIPKLEDASSALSRVKSATKTRVARDLMHALEKLSKALRNGSELPRAELLLTTVRHNLITKRVKEIASRYVRARFRELALRKARDEWLLSISSQFASDPLAIYRYSVADEHNRLAVLSRLKSLARKKKKDALLEQMLAFSQNFRVPERTREGSEAFVLDSYAGKAITNAGKDALIGHYALAYLHAKNSEWQLCLHELNSCELFVKANKPGFLLEELTNGNERYLLPAISALEALVQCLEEAKEGNLDALSLETRAKQFYLKVQEACSIKQ